eukprot:COSAG05_NODE_2250_length_3338_cov_7.489349_1_plen_63_part_00
MRALAGVILWYHEAIVPAHVTCTRFLITCTDQNSATKQPNVARWSAWPMDPVAASDQTASHT